MVPDWNAYLDVDASIAATPEHATVRGMFIMDLVNAVAQAGQEDAAGFGNYIAFKKYPVREYMEVAVRAAQLVHPGESVRQALRRLGRVVYPNFVQTMIGAAIFALAGKDFGRVAKFAPKAYNVAIDPGRVDTLVRGERHVEVQLREVWTFPESLQIGVWEGALAACEARGQIRLRTLSPCDADFEIRWDDRT